MKLLRQLRNVMTSADTAWPQPDGIAVTPAIGPLPAILVSPTGNVTHRLRVGTSDDESL
jgi:hypothetical protein